MTDTILAAGPSTATSSTPVVTPVTAVVVTRGRTPYLATTLRALAAQTRRPTRVLLVDAAARPDDALAAELAAAFAGVESPGLVTMQAPGARTFGHAVRAALAGDGAPATAWVWLLHDDSAPAPTALAELVRAVGRAPSVVLAGAKQRTWTEPERLLEVGVRTSRLGRRMTDVEPGELDQGQHDGRDDVLAVGLAGALVRRDAWDELRGPDAALGPFGDGADLSRRARLAGHRVIVVPGAVVRHAQASFLGLRGEGAAAAAGVDETERAHSTGVEEGGVDADGDGEDDRADTRRSFAARRRAVVHQRLVGAPLPALPFVGLFCLVAAFVRAAGQLAVKQPRLAVAELRAVLGALLALASVVRGRRTAARTRRLARRRLWPLQATNRDVYGQWRDRRLARAAARKVVQAPSELELSELRALATRRRVTLAFVVAALALVTVVGFGSLLGPAIGGAHLVGGALVVASGGFSDVWHAATSGWVADGLGGRGPADALLTALALPTAATGSLGPVVTVLTLGGLVLAGAGAWAAAGAATRSVGVRAWAAVVWAGAPALLLGVGAGRLGAVVAHVALPWVAFGVARALGVQRVDQVLSGLVTANHDHEPDVPWFPDDEEQPADRSQAWVVPAPRPPQSGPVPMVAQERVGAPNPVGSVAAAAGAALAFALVVAGAPVLLLPGLVALVVVAVVAPRRRLRVLLVPVPGLVLLAPLVATAVARGADGWRLLVADPGLPFASAPSSALQRLLGVPADPSALVPSWVPAALVTAWPLALGAVVLALALLALLRGRPAARAVRAAWLVGAVGLATAAAAAALPVAVDDGAIVHGWSGPGLSLALLGFLTAGVVGTDRLVERLARYSFGWRQLVSGLLAVVAAIVPVVWLGSWAWQARQGDAVALTAVDRSVVPAVARQAQGAPASSRVLTLTVRGTGPDPVVAWQLLRGDGALVLDQSAATATRTLTGGARDAVPAEVDSATTEVDDLVARIAGSSAGDVAGGLAALAVAHVLVPVAPDQASTAEAAARAELVARLDSTAGLARVTDNESGTVWRVQATAPAPGQPAPTVVPTWARIVPVGADVTNSATPATAVAAQGRSVGTTIGSSAPGGVLVLAERRDAGWRATLDGRPLRAVDDGWRQAFALPAGGGDLQVHYVSPARTPWLAALGVVGLVTVLLALPLRRRRVGRS